MGNKMKLGKIIEKYLPMVGGVLFLVAVIPLGIGSTKSMPGNAVLLVNFETGEYISPPCFISEKHLGFFLPARNEDIKGDKYHPEPECREAGGFYGEWQNVWTAWLFPESRWNDDGTWRY